MSFEDAESKASVDAFAVGIAALTWAVVMFVAGALVGLHAAPPPQETSIVDVAGECAR